MPAYRRVFHEIQCMRINKPKQHIVLCPYLRLMFLGGEEVGRGLARQLLRRHQPRHAHLRRRRRRAPREERYRCIIVGCVVEVKVKANATVSGDRDVGALLRGKKTGVLL